MRARAQERAGEREKSGEEERERKGEKAMAREGVGTLRRSFDEEARQSSSTRENAFCPPTPRLSLSLSLVLLGRVNPSNLAVLLSLSPCPPAGATGRVSPWAQPGPRATRACPIQHPARDDTLPSPSLPPFSFSVSPSRSVPRFHTFSRSFSLFLTSLYTHDAYDRARSRHGRWQRVRGT